MGDITLSGNPPIPVIVRRSARARRVSLRLSQLDGRVTLTLPKRLAEAEALDFLMQKETWLRRHLAARGDDVAVRLGARIPVHGVERTIIRAEGRAVRFEDGALAVPGPETRIAARTQGWLKALARDRLAEASDRYADHLAKPYTRLSIRDTRSRWGSCSSSGALMYSWRLVLAPPEVLDYVAAHEVAHLAEMNHSPAFWAIVARLYGDWKVPRRWLRDNGATLHRYRFDD